jgi:hypothetical protein
MEKTPAGENQSVEKEHAQQTNLEVKKEEIQKCRRTDQGMDNPEKAAGEIKMQDLDTLEDPQDETEKEEHTQLSEPEDMEVDIKA